MKKILFLVLGFILVGFTLLFVAQDWVIKIVAEYEVTRITGFKTKAHSLKYDFPSTILIKELEILNPSGFQEKVFVNIPEIYVSFDLFGFFKGKGIHFSEIRLDIQEVHIEKNLKGVSNVDLLRTVGGSRKSKQSLPPQTPKPLVPFLLEHFEFSLRNVSYQDHSGMYGSSGLPNKLSVDMNIQKRVYKDIHDPQILVNLILTEIIRRETFGRLLNLDPKQLLGENLYGVVNSGQEFIGEQANALTRQAGSVFQDSVQGTQGVFTDTTAASQKAVSGFLGKLKSFMPEEKTTAKAQ